jgi:hypothetical protein
MFRCGLLHLITAKMTRYGWPPLPRAGARGAPSLISGAYPGNTASILVFSVAALNGLTM